MAFRFLYINLIVSTEIEHIGALGWAFCSVYNVTTASVKTVAVLATETIFKAVFRHVITVALTAREPVREVISGTAASNLSAAPVGFPNGN